MTIGNVTTSPVRLPPQSPSRYIPSRQAGRRPHRPVAPAVSKSLHSAAAWEEREGQSGCPRSLQVATFSPPRSRGCWRVRLPPQSPSRYILGAAALHTAAGPVAPAVSKSLHSMGSGWLPTSTSGCPRSLQVATFARALRSALEVVRLPPQSPSRYILAPVVDTATSRPVAPAVSKSLHSRSSGSTTRGRSGCPRSLQVATFGGRIHLVPVAVRLPPQSPSRYIPLAGAPPGGRSPVAPAVSKSLHSERHRGLGLARSGCPRSLQVATFPSYAMRAPVPVRLPPQSPSRYIPRSRAR